MSAYPRRVRRLTVRAASDAAARRVAIQLEDALHTASLPGGDSARLVVIRSLRLARIPAGSSSAFLASAIEQRLWELGSAAVHALDPAAVAANSVYFTDAAEAHTLLASRLATGRGAAEWFWAAAVPAVRNHADRDSALREVFQSICELDGALIVAGRLVRDLAAAGKADAVCRVWQAGDASAWTAALVPALSRISPERGARISAPFEQLLRRWIGVWGADDARSLWLAAIAIAAERPIWAGDARLRTGAVALIRSLASASDDGNGKADRRLDGAVPLPTVGGAPARHDAGETVAMATWSRRGRQSAVRTLPGAPAPGSAAPGAGVTADGPVDTVFVREPHTAARDWQRTGAGGLLFLLHPLRHLGIARALADDPDAPNDLALRILTSVAWRLRVLPDDPMWLLLGHNADVRRVMADYTVHTWVAALRRWCRLHARSGLRGIVRRDAFVLLTDTHVDVRFDPQLVDVRFRRAGLDLDPGWIPWFGRVVRFHYSDGRRDG